MREKERWEGRVEQCDLCVVGSRMRCALERRGMKVTRSETEYMSVNERKKETAR